MKKLRLILAATAIALVCGCGSDDTTGNTTEATTQAEAAQTTVAQAQASQPTASAQAEVKVMGNSASNYINNGSATSYGNEIYYLGRNENGKGIFKMDNSTGVATMLFDVQGTDISTVNGEVFYLSDGSIYKMPASGGAPEIFKEDGAIEDMCLTSEWLYYVKKDNNGLGKIYKTTLSGTGDKLLTPKSESALDIKTITFENSKIYFTDSKGIGSVYLDGSNINYLFTDYVVEDYAIYGDYLYFVYQGKVFRIKAGAGSEAVQCNAANVKRINIAGDMIYLVSDSGIGKMPAVGGAVTVISPEKPTEISVSGDYVFGTKGLYFYRMKTDGSEAVAFNK